MKHFSISFVIVIFILLASIPLYIYNLSVIPIAFHGDEAETALQALKISTHNLNIFGLGWFDIPLISFLPYLLTMHIFGQTIFGARIGSVLFGLMTLPFFYLLLIQLVPKKAAFFATIILTFSHVWLALSRLGIAYVQAACILVLFFYFFTCAIKKNYLGYIFIAGILLGLSFYSYYAARIIPILFFIYILIISFKYQEKKKLFIYIFYTITISFLLFIPLGLTYLQHPEAFSSRTKEVFIFSKETQDWRISAYGKQTNLQLIGSQIIHSLDISKGDGSGQYGYKGIIFDTVTLTFFFFGVVYVFWKRTVGSLFIFTWFVISFILSEILTASPIFIPRFVVGIPSFFALCGLGFELLYDVMKKKKKIFYILSSIFVTIIIIWNLYNYFAEYPYQEAIDQAGDVNANNATLMAQYVNALSNKTIFLLTNPNLYASFSTLQFLSPNKNYINISSISSTPKTDHSLFILYPDKLNELYELQKNFPQGKLKKIKKPNGLMRFYIFQS